MDTARLDPILIAFCALFGAVVGSFLNAVIYRLPRNISLLRERRSFCPRCRAQIAWYDNIPVLSYLLLLGRCRRCRGRIAPRYLLVELLTAGLFAALYWHVRVLNAPAEGPGAAYPDLLWGRPGWAHLGVYLVLTAGLICAAFTDIEDYEETAEEKAETARRVKELAAQGKKLEDEVGPAVYGIIPDEVTVGGLVLALPLAVALPEVHWDMLRLTPWPRLDAAFDSALGAVAGAGLTYGMGVFGKVFFGKQAMGFGDVKLMGMIGALLGWKAALMVFFVAPVFGAIFGIVARLISGERYVRYGPFLAGAAVLIVFFEPVLSAFVGAALSPGASPEFHHRVPFLAMPERHWGPW